MDKRIGFFGLVSVAALSGAIACTTSTTTTETTPNSGDGGTAKDGGSSTTKDSGGGSSSGDSGSSTDPDQACGEEASLQGCAQCCATNHPSGYKTFADTLLACACDGTGADGGTGPCATDCQDTACASTPATPTAACNTCLQGSVGSGGACQQAVSDACTAEQDCLAQQKCVAQCQGKK